MENLEKDLEKAVAATANPEEKKVTLKRKVTLKEKKEKKETNLNEILSSLSSISLKKGNGGIYKDSLFKGMTLQEKRKVRTKLRATLDKFINLSFQFSKDSVKMDAIKKDWKKYAVSVYKDVNCIYDGSNELKEKDIKRFLSQMEGK